MFIKEPFSEYAHGKRSKAINPSSFKGSNIKTPKHFYYHWQNPQPETRPMVIGRALHTLVLEPELFEKEYFCLTREMFGENCTLTKDGNPDLRDSNNYLVYQKAISDNIYKTVLTFSEVKDVYGMSEGLKNDITGLKQLINPKKGYIEHSLYLFAEFSDTGKFICLKKLSPDEYYSLSKNDKTKFLPVRTRIDYVRNGFDYALDLKSTKDAHPSAFPYSVLAFGYHYQSSFICDCLNAEYNDNICDTFIFLVVENTPPYAAIKYNCSNSLLRSGTEDYINRLEYIYYCFKSNNFAGYDIFTDIAYKEFDDNGNVKKSYQVLDLDLPPRYYRDKEYQRNRYGKNIF